MNDHEQTSLATAVAALGDEHAIGHPAVEEIASDDRREVRMDAEFAELGRAIDVALGVTTTDRQTYAAAAYLDGARMMRALYDPDWERRFPAVFSSREIDTVVTMLRDIDPMADADDAETMLRSLIHKGTRYMYVAPRRSA